MKSLLIDYSKFLSSGYEFRLENNNIIVISYKGKSLSCRQSPVNYIFTTEENSIYISTSEYELNYQKVFFRKILGTYKSIIKGMIDGLEKEHKISVTIGGVGFRMSYSEDNPKYIRVIAGKTHPIFIEIPLDVRIMMAKDGNEVSMFSANKQSVGLLGQRLVTCVKFNYYKLAGLYYTNTKPVKKNINKKA